jgi:hypothetical protein
MSHKDLDVTGINPVKILTGNLTLDLKRTALFWVVTQRVVAIYRRCSTALKTRPNRLNQNIGKKLPLPAAQQPRRVHVSSVWRRKPKITHDHWFNPTLIHNGPQGTMRRHVFNEYLLRFLERRHGKISGAMIPTEAQAPHECFLTTDCFRWQLPPRVQFCNYKMGVSYMGTDRGEYRPLIFNMLGRASRRTNTRHCSTFWNYLSVRFVRLN